MDIIIAGAGKVGFNLAKNLCIGHNVTIIDKNKEALQRIEESLDIMPLDGDVENPATYEKFLQKDIDLFIAVTNIDSVNIVSSVVASGILKIEKIFVRLQNRFYKNSDINRRLGIDKVIFPIQLASAGIASLLHYPKANNVKFFKYTKHKLISLRVSKEIEPQEVLQKGFVVVGIERGDKFFIPRGDVEILSDDLIYCFGDESEIRNMCIKFNTEAKQQTNKCVVFGGGELGIAISKELLSVASDIKLIESDIWLCEHANEELQGRVSVINSKYTTGDIFEDEGLKDADIFISATNNDEFNIIKCLEAKRNGISKVIAIHNEMEYYNLMHSLGIIVVRGPKMTAYNTIMEDIGSNGVVVQKSFCGAKGHLFMRKIFPKSKLIGKKLKPIKLETASVFYIRNEKLYSFNEKMEIEQNDIIVAFCTTNESHKVKFWIYEL